MFMYFRFHCLHSLVESGEEAITAAARAMMTAVLSRKQALPLLTANRTTIAIATNSALLYTCTPPLLLVPHRPPCS